MRKKSYLVTYEVDKVSYRIYVKVDKHSTKWQVEERVSGSAMIGCKVGYSSDGHWER
ncbi:hypothetical protein ACPE2A_000749 [Enterococcus hirae]